LAQLVHPHPSGPLSEKSSRFFFPSKKKKGNPRPAGRCQGQTLVGDTLKKNLKKIWKEPTPQPGCQPGDPITKQNNNNKNLTTAFPTDWICQPGLFLS
jgi:hypothetical protein